MRGLFPCEKHKQQQTKSVIFFFPLLSLFWLDGTAKELSLLGWQLRGFPTRRNQADKQRTTCISQSLFLAAAEPNSYYTIVSRL